ncbi:MAG: rod shape-determining protein MreC [Actinobacteria bacterium]|nr:rod shape-determining protein MreC [Actinomycetota bacterium]
MKDFRRLRVIIGVLILTCATLIVLTVREDSGGPLRSVGNAIFGPLERGASAVFTPIGGFFSDLGSWRDSVDRVKELEAENEKLKALVVTSAEDRARVAELDALLKLSAAGQYRMVPAQVIAIGPRQDFAWTVTIDAGSRDGLGVDMTVVNGSGLVGRVVSVGETTATVALLIDATTSLGGRIAQSQEIGIVSGTGAQYELQMQILDPLAPVDAGTAVVTFGSEGGRPYVPGVPIGVVTEVKGSPGQLARIAVLRPYVDMSTLDLVGVITEPPRVDPRDAVLPSATPVPSPSAS